MAMNEGYAKEQPKSPFQDPTLLERARGDDDYLTRLVGEKLARRRLEEQPDNPTFQTLYEQMHTEVEQYELRHGIASPPTDETT